MMILKLKLLNNTGDIFEEGNSRDVMCPEVLILKVMEKI